VKNIYQGSENIKIFRDQNGIPHIEADDLPGLLHGMGYCHAKDRGLQILLMRILGRGEASEFLESGDEMLKVDLFFRRMNWYGNTDKEIANLPPDARKLCEAYCMGINDCFSKKQPWEFRLVGCKPPPWSVEDTILLARMTGYLTMAQSQGDVERLLVEMVRADVPPEKLEELFPGLLTGIDRELIKKVKLSERLVPEKVRWAGAAASFTASNNWAVAGGKTASGKPILANDPHLETNRLPNIWYELALKTKERFAMGATMPGLPVMLIGRTDDLAWGATYSFMDSVDSWIEECRDGKRRREDDGWQAFYERKELIKRKGKSPKEVTFFDSDHGTLDGSPYEAGFYLSTRWSGAGTGAESLRAMLKMWDAKNVEEGMKLLGAIEISFNWVLADKDGNIGYQMSGLMPKRGNSASGFIPLKGWDSRNDWNGFVPLEELPRTINPKEQFIVTANNDLNHLGKAAPINMPMGEYRVQRINDLLLEAGSVTAQDMFKIQLDVRSLQAERFMDFLRPLLPDTPQGKILGKWDLCYEPESEGAFLFEQFYRALFLKVFGDFGLGEKVAGYLAGETGILTAFYRNFDRILLSEKSRWFNGMSREEIFRETAAQALAVEPMPWGDANAFTLTNMFFSGKLPRFLGFDRGPVRLRGGRATINQGQTYRAAGRTSSFCPSFRMVIDFGEDHIYTNLAGGPSDRRFSRWYCSDLANWLNGVYKKVRSGV
jgi:penicillin amidase